MFKVGDRVKVDNLDSAFSPGASYWIGRVGEVVNIYATSALPVAVSFLAPPPCGVVNFAQGELRMA